MSQLPQFIRAYVERRAAEVGTPRLKQAAALLSHTYRAQGTTKAAGLPEDRTVAYLATRLPATYAAAGRVIEEIAPVLPEVGSLLDLGAGCGAATLAAEGHFALRQRTLIESDPGLAAAGQDLLPEAEWRRERLHPSRLPQADLVFASYALGEMPPAERDAIVSAAWQSARHALVVIEPGSPRGFETVLRIRGALLAQGAHIAAPCPNTLACPVAGRDWCHFAARVERTALHRQLKDGALSYEDEKFSYIVLTKAPVPVRHARIIGRPEHSPGVVQLSLCANGMAFEARVGKRDKALYRLARKAEWGDGWGATSEMDPIR